MMRKIAIGLIVGAFVGAKVFLLFSRRAGIGVAILGAIILIFSESENANYQEPKT